MSANQSGRSWKNLTRGIAGIGPSNQEVCPFTLFLLKHGGGATKISIVLEKETFPPSSLTDTVSTPATGNTVDCVFLCKNCRKLSCILNASINNGNSQHSTSTLPFLWPSPGTLSCSPLDPLLARVYLN